MSTLWLYLVVFVGGPGLFLLCWYRSADPRGLAAGALVSSLGGPALQFLGSGWGTSIAAVGLVWLGWVLVMAAGALSIARSQAQYATLSRIVGAIGTTIPWFGYALAAQFLE